MFSWLRRLVKSKTNPLIFHYHDGTRVRSVDPVEVERTLVLRLGESWRSKLEGLRNPIPLGIVGEQLEQVRSGRLATETTVLAAIDEAFDVHGFRDGEGLSIPMRHALLAGFNRFCIDLIELARPFVKQQSRASPTHENSQPVSGPVSTSPAT